MPFWKKMFNKRHLKISALAFTTAAVIMGMADVWVHEQSVLGLYVLFITTAAPQRFANSCKHDLLLRSACTFFDKTGKRKNGMGRISVKHWLCEIKALLLWLDRQKVKFSIKAETLKFAFRQGQQGLTLQR